MNQQIFRDIDCEKAILGYLIYNPGTLYLVKDVIENLDYFSDPAHRDIYEAMLDWDQEENGDWSELGLGKALDKIGKLKKAGGYTYLAKIQELAPGDCHLPYYAKILRGHYLANKSIKLANELIAKLSKPDAELETTIGKAIEKFRNIQSKLGTKKNKIRTVSEIVPDVFKEMQETEKSGRSPALSTGITALDEQYGGGLFAGCMNIIAGDPGSGKTSLALHIANYNAPVIDILLVSLETTGHSTVRDRLLPINTGVSSTNIKIPDRLGPDDWERLGAGIDSLSRYTRFDICENAFISIEEIEILLMNKHLILEGRPFLFILDYVQRMKLSDDKNKTWEKFREISVRLSALIKDVNVFNITIAQLNREAKKRGQRPTMANLGHSSQLEKDAHTVGILWENDGQTTFILDKHRDGPTGDVPLLFNKKFTRFEEAAKGGF